MPVVLAGDYNVVPTDADIYNAALVAARTRCCSRRPRAAYRRLLAQGWTDALRTLHPDERDLHVLGLPAQPLGARRRPAHRPPAAQPGLAERLVDAGVDREVRGREKASDHAPAWVVLG